MYFYLSFQMDYALNSIQQLYILIVVHTLPPLAIIFGKEDKSMMTLNPRKSDSILTRELLQLLVVFCALFSVSMLLAYFLYFDQLIFQVESLTSLYPIAIDGNPLEASADSFAQAKARTMLISIAVVAESLIILSIQRVNTSVLRVFASTPLFTWAMILLPNVFHLLLMYLPLPFIAETGLDFVQLSTFDWMFVLVFGLLPIIALELFKGMFIQSKIQI